MKNIAKLAAGAAAACLLSACGGGGTSGGVGIIPAPPPPPPPAATYPSFAALTSSQQVALTGIAVGRTDRSGAGGSTPGVNAIEARPYANGSLSIAYDAATNSYTIRDGAASQAFAAADLRPDFAFNGPAFQNYARGVGSASEDYLSLYRPGGGGGDVALTYTTLAMWTRLRFTDDGTTTTTRTDATWGVGGFETVASDMPRTGGASYAGPLRGQYVNGTAVENVTGQARLVADFAAASVRADLFLNRSGASTLTVGGTGTIAAARFLGSLAGGGYSGTFDGAFFGPRAAEMGLSFSLAGSGAERIGGVGAGRQ
ncbi:MAG TPA: transferrin-binding protein-like solute binding protein [Allosphingosinicella sp.]